ncbi:MAG: ComF family protein [Armatimonadota bacterium]|jgi:ComF family protein
MNLRQLVSDALDLVFPPKCQVCGRFSPELFCDTCRASVAPIRSPFCHGCGRPFDPKGTAGDRCGDCRLGAFHFDIARAPATHTGALRKAVIAFKFYGRRRLAQPLGEVLAEFVRELPPGPQAIDADAIDAVVPVPLHEARENWRGYNQAVLLAEHLAAAIERPLRPDVLVRRRPTEPQIDLTPRQRQTNVRGAFEVPLPEAVEGRSLLLIDDVFTTGSTLSECARVLKRAGAAHVACLTLTRSRPDWDKDRDLF